MATFSWESQRVLALFLLLNAVSRGSTCEIGWSAYSHRCYKLVHAPKQFSAASRDCWYLGGSLASVNNDAVNRFLEGMIGDDMAWIGLQRAETSNETCKTLECIREAFGWTDDSDTSYTNWYTEPGFDGYVVKLSSQGWIAGRRDERWKYICEKDDDDCTPDPCVNGQCIDIGSYSVCQCDWDSGYEGPLCEWNVDDCSPNPCVHGVCVDGLAAFTCICHPGFKGELCDDDDDCVSNPCNNGVCVDLISAFSCTCDLGFQGTLCNEPRADMCDHGWVEYNSKCYKFFHELQPWYDANTHCQSFKGTLVTTNNSAENAFVKTLLPGKATAWIGVRNHQSIICTNRTCLQENSFWIDGSVYDYHEWSPTDPNSGHCGRVTSNGWFGDSCHVLFPYICEKDQDELVACNFGTATPGSMCSLIQDDSDDFDWMLQHGSTPNKYTGPVSGYGGSGYYIFTAAGYPRIEGDKARILTKNLNYTGAICVRFAYSMYGVHTGSLRLIYFSNPNFVIEQWTRKGDQGFSWLLAAVDMKSDFDMTLAWEATRGQGPEGDIAVDKIHVFKTSCARSKITEEPKDLVTCNFESGTICNLQQSTSEHFDWSIYPLETASADTGLMGGYNGYGVYIFIEAASQYQGAVARIYTDPLQYNGDICVRFAYHMHGVEGFLRIVYFTTNENARTSVWGVAGDQGADWLQAMVDVKAGKDMRLGWEAMRGPGPTGDIALDEIRVSTLHCPSADDRNTSSAPAKQTDDNTGSQTTKEKEEKTDSKSIVLACGGLVVALAVMIALASVVLKRDKTSRKNSSRHLGYQSGTRV